MSVYKRKSGRYAVLVDLEPTALGGRRRKSIGTYRTRKEAEAAERKATTVKPITTCLKNLAEASSQHQAEERNLSHLARTFQASQTLRLTPKPKALRPRHQLLGC